MKRRSWAAPVAALVLLASPPGANALSPERASPVVRVVEKVSPSVVNISTEQDARSPWPGFDDPFFDQFFRDFFERSGRGRARRSLGSGVLVDPRGYILTNAHVVARADRISVTLEGKEPQEASLVGYDRGTDLGVIRIHGNTPFPAIPLARSDDLMIGETVVAIGNPFGLSHTVSVGVISAINRSLRLDEGVVFHDFIQTDAPINPGNSGGPLLAIDGSLIGITTAIYQKGQGIGFAIPADRARRVMKSLTDSGTVRPSFLGIVPRSGESDAAGAGVGVEVAEVISGSPAHRGGVRAGDLVIGVGGSPVAGAEELWSILDSYPPGSVVPLEVARGGKASSISVVGEPYSGATLIATLAATHGLSVSEAGGHGVAVTRVARSGPARAAGLRAGDVITAWGQTKLSGIADLVSAVDALPLSRPVQLILIRGGERYRANLPSPGP